MNTLDLVVLALAVIAGTVGYRLGFVTRITSWIGRAAGVALAAIALPPVLDRFEDGTPTQLLLIVLGAIFVGGMVGETLGRLVGLRLHVALPHGGVRQADRAAGGLLGVAGIVFTVWLVVPVLADVPGWFAVEARTSAVADVISRHLPDPPDAWARLRRYVPEGQLPRVLDALEPAPDLGPPPASSGLSQAVSDRVVTSTVKVQGVACRRIQEGSGWVLAEGLVVTNAHVVAGESSTVLQRSDGTEVEATVVAFDPNRDLAVLRAPGLRRAPLPRSTAKAGDIGAVYGHPGGGPLLVRPFQVGREVVATGTDIYDASRTERNVLVLAADLHPGDSGGALVDPEGEVVGVAFAIAPDKGGVAYALAMDELDAVIAGDLTREVDTGPCLR